MQRQQRVLLQDLVQAQVQALLRQQERRLLRCEGRVLLRVQMQHREQALLRFDERARAGRVRPCGRDRSHLPDVSGRGNRLTASGPVALTVIHVAGRTVGPRNPSAGPRR